MVVEASEMMQSQIREKSRLAIHTNLNWIVSSAQAKTISILYAHFVIQFT